MTGSSTVAPAGASRAPSIRHPLDRYLLPAISIAAAGAAMVVLMSQPIAPLYYDVAVVPPVVPWVAAGLSIVVAAVSLRERWVTSTTGSLLIGALGIATLVSVSMLPFDALRIVGLIPLPLSGWGLALRLLLLASGMAALVPAMRTRRARQVLCPTCQRVLPGSLDRLPRWPIVVALLAALVYPALRIAWALGATFGTTGDESGIDPVVVAGLVGAGGVLLAFITVLLIGRGPRWVRALLGVGGLMAGLALAVNGGLAAMLALGMLVTDGPDSSPGAGLLTWTFLLVYGAWFVAGLGVIVGSWRYWAHRRDDCPTCGPMLEA